MSDQIMTYTPGTLVWMKVYNRIWWPGKVVDPKTSPPDVQVLMQQEKNPIAMIYFERHNKYEIVNNMDRVALYSCSKKMVFVEIGYFLYLKQKNGSKIQSVDMQHFVADVVKFEKEINGNINIFKQLEQKKDKYNTLSKSLFQESSDSSKKRKKNDTDKKKRKKKTILKKQIENRSKIRGKKTVIKKTTYPDESDFSCSSDSSIGLNTSFYYSSDADEQRNLLYFRLQQRSPSSSDTNY